VCCKYPYTRPRFTLAGHAGLATALRRGLTVRVTGATAGKLTLSARRGKAVVARGTAKVGAGGRTTLRLRFTATARKQLRRARSVRPAITGGGTTLRVTIRR
jgi:hypothetical protein